MHHMEQTLGHPQILEEVMTINMHYSDFWTDYTDTSREFESCMAALRCGDSNPLRQYLELPLKGECEDCGDDHELVGHYFSLVCKTCADARNSELEAFIDTCDQDWSKR